MSLISPIIGQTNTFQFPISFKQDHSPNPDDLALLIDRTKASDHLRQIHAFIIRRNLENHPTLNFKLQRSYSSLGRVKDSVSLFERTQGRNVFFYTSIISGLARNGLNDEAFLLYLQMLMEDVLPNAFTMSTVLKICPLQAGKPLHGHAYKFGFESDAYVRTALVDVYARGGDLVHARKLYDKMLEPNFISSTAMIAGHAKNGDVDEGRALFDRMGEKDVVTWNVMIDGYAQHGQPNEALHLFNQMLTEKLKPNEATLLAVLSACAQLGALESGQWVHSYAKLNRMSINAQIGTALIDMYSKCGSLEDAVIVFDAIKYKDAIAYNAMINGYAIHGFSQEAFDLFDEMSRAGIKPTDVTFIGLLSACANAGLISKGWHFFDAMGEKFSIQPKIEHYGCMVNLLGRAGKLEEAYELITNSSLKPDPILWGTLLAACKLHKNVVLGEKIAGFLSKEDLASSGTYVLLSNMYAEAENWEGVAKTRAKMKQIGVRKEPGCSSIEVDNVVHEFLAGDARHERRKEIHEMLDEMNEWVRSRGYVSRAEGVSHDVDEMGKERSLWVHSEKLALAFGLISTEAGKTVKIFKNLRVCDDCHVVMKIVSGITGRKIVMRDRSRFHHFVGGFCSCGDYW